MRCSEVLGLRGEYVYDDHLYLCGQYDEYGYRETKTKIKHHIPLAGEVVEDLRKLMKVNGEDYVFSLDGGVTPVTRKYIQTCYMKILAPKTSRLAPWTAQGVGENVLTNK